MCPNNDCREINLVDESQQEPSGSQESVHKCPRCRGVYQRSSWQEVETVESMEVAAEVRSRILGDRWDRETSVDSIADFGVLEDRVADRIEHNVSPMPNPSPGTFDECVGPREPQTRSRDEDDDQPDVVDVQPTIAQSPQLKKGAKSTEPGVSEWEQGQSELFDLRMGIEPQFSEWVPDLQEQLLPKSARLVTDLARDSVGELVGETENGIFWEFPYEDYVYQELVPYWKTAHTRRASHRTKLNVQQYYELLFEWAIDAVGSHDDPETKIDEWQAKRRKLRLFGTGNGPNQSGKDALSGFSELHTRGKVETIILDLESDDWVGVLEDNPETAESTLEVIDILGEAFDLRVNISPELKSKLKRQFPEWTDANLKESTNTPRGNETDDLSEATDLDLWELIQEIDNEKKQSILVLLADGKERSIDAITEDFSVEASRNTVGQYTNELVDLGLVEVRDNCRPKQYSITENGRIIVGKLEDGFGVTHPHQVDLSDASYCDHSRSDKYSVSADASWEGFPASLSMQGKSASKSSPSAEAVADSGAEAEEATSYVEWLPRPNNIRVGTAHNRLAAVTECFDRPGVTMVDQPAIDWFDEGRTSFMSYHDEHVLGVVQWGGPLPTLGRLTSVLTDNRLMSNALSVDRVGKYFEHLFPGVSRSVSYEFLQDSSQIGYLPEEMNLLEWKSRIRNVRAELLERVGKAQAGELDQEAREDLFRDLHGLRTAMVAMYSLAGNDLSLHLRFPDALGISSDPGNAQDFVRFVESTIPKQGAYDGMHSAWRHLFETRPDKLRQRIMPDLDPEDGDENRVPAGDLLCDWVIVADDSNELEPLVEEGLQASAEKIRDSVENGDEEQFILDIPIYDGNSKTAIRRVIREICQMKGMKPWGGRNVETGYRRLVRAYSAVLGGEDHGPSPINVATSLLLLTSDPDVTERLTIGDIASGLSMLNPDRLLPESEKPSEKRLLSTLLGATGGENTLSREELKEQADVSEGSLSNLKTLMAFDLVEKNSEGRYRATLEPWWADGNDREEPYVREMRETEPTNGHWQTVVEEAIHRSGKIDSLSTEEYTQLYLDYQTPVEVLEALGWERFIPFLEAYCLDGGVSQGETPDQYQSSRQEIEPDPSEGQTHRLGRVPDQFSQSQQTLAAA